MARQVDRLVAHYRDETGQPQEMEIPVPGGCDLGKVVNRLTNGSVTQDSHIISVDGVPKPDSTPITGGEKITASPRKTGGGN